MKRLLYAALITLVCAGTSLAQAAENRGSSQSVQAVRDVLTSIEKSWNSQDTRAFLANYWHSPDLTVFSSSAETKGWDGESSNITKGFKDPSVLTLSNVQVESLGPTSAYAKGQWEVRASDGTTHQGVFTIVFRNFGHGWKVVHDHASGGQ